eukprot:scaffold10567_cov70-Cyclotella_meneghiniana.AAC.3
MAMVESPCGSAVGGRSNHGRRTTPRKLEGRLEKAEGQAGSGKNKSPQMSLADSLGQWPVKDANAIAMK